VSKTICASIISVDVPVISITDVSFRLNAFCDSTLIQQVTAIIVDVLEEKYFQVRKYK
jgi:hypothetical protein